MNPQSGKRNAERDLYNAWSAADDAARTYGALADAETPGDEVVKGR